MVTINGITKSKLEIHQQHQCDAYKDIDTGQASKDHKEICAHFVFDVKHDGRQKAIIVADGYFTNVALSSVYSGVAFLRGIRSVLFLAELNGLESWGTDTENACLEAFTKEKVFIVASPTFGHLEGHNLIILKSLHGLRTSGSRCH